MNNQTIGLVRKAKHWGVLCVLPAILIGFARAGEAQNVFVLDYSDELRQVDLTTGTVLSSVTITLQGASIESGTALAVHPDTQLLYAVLNLVGQTGRELVTIDPGSGAATSIGNIGERISSIDFRSDGVLYGMVGNAPLTLPGNSLSTISLADASPTFVLQLNGNGGQAIAFNRDNGLLYHTAGREVSQTRVFESVNVDTQDIMDIPLSGHVYEATFGLTFAGCGSFLAVDGFPDTLFELAADGVATLITPISPAQATALAFSPGGRPCIFRSGFESGGEKGVRSTFSTFH